MASGPDPEHAGTHHTHTHTAFAVGMLNGLAGTSHLLGVIPALTRPGLSASLGYLGGFNRGTVGDEWILDVIGKICEVRCSAGRCRSYRECPHVSVVVGRDGESC